MSNTLQAFTRLFDTVIEEFNEDYNVSNRVNQVGEALEKFIKDLYANSVDLPDYKLEHPKVFSYLGAKNSPPDAILKGSDAIEIKKIQIKETDDSKPTKRKRNTPPKNKLESHFPQLQLNSSAPKKYLLRTDPLINTKCVTCEKDENLPTNQQWQQKDMLYVVGTLLGKKLCSLWFVYGDCYSASASTYSTVKATVTQAIKESGIELGETNEIARLNKVDPLEITDLRVRGMWLLAHPYKAFDYLKLTVDTPFYAHLIVSKEKYDKFPKNDKDNLEKLTIEHSDVITKKNVNILDPDNPAQFIESVVVSLCR